MALACILLSACADNQAYPSASPAAASPDPADVLADYQLGASDKVRINVYNEETLSGEYVVGPSGKIAFPLIGEVEAANMTAAQLGESIRAKLADGFINDPHVTVEVVAFRPVYVMGEVNHAGQYPYTSGLTVLNAISAAEGFTYRAQKRYVFLTRAGSSKEVRVEVTPSLRVYPGDTIRVAERYF
ncbi:polysaccharide export protein [Stakelama sp. CBK3Z-3]|uniref:Polysaccharide export protein n=1 Tax=Stakelama flava TaxID=2860338 RepID=A0ABS6XKH1_9SPHN|nr:polysaccharide biosynthesis/export family protein [Stakelama flava]MBW4329910.1 polysaccharide export protein [Stakelama flava]